MKLKELKKKYPGAETFVFGDSEALCEQLLALVRAGKKTATCAAVEEYKMANEAMPEPGWQGIALNWDGTPALVIETVEINIIKFCDVDEEFALAEGENDSLEGWQRDHRAYFERNSGFSPEMLVVCERFRLIEDLV